jgi:hypothetical protein
VFGPCRGDILKIFGAKTQLREVDWRVEVSNGKFVVEEELEVSLRRLNEMTWIHYVCYSTVILGECD